MKPKFDKDRLLAEMVMDDAGEAREALLGRTLLVARRVRRGRRVRRVALVVAVLAAVGYLGQRSTLLRSSASQGAALKEPVVAAAPQEKLGKSYILIETVPLDTRLVVRTMAPVTIVETFHDPTLRILNDAELLAMAPAASMLRRTSFGEAELILGQ